MFNDFRGSWVRLILILNLNNRSSVLSLSFNTDNKLLASGGISDELFIWSLQDKKIIRGFEVSQKSQGGMVLDTNWSHDGILLSAGNNKLVTLFDIRYLQWPNIIWNHTEFSFSINSFVEASLIITIYRILIKFDLWINRIF